MLDLQHYQGIIFDMDGTLVDSMESHLTAWKMACDHFGLPFDKDFLHSLGGVPSERIVERLNARYDMSCSPADVAAYKYQAWNQLENNLQLIPETTAIYNHYRPSKKIGIGTGAKRESAEFILQSVGLLDELDVLVTASDVVHGKPAPDTFLRVAELLGADARTCVVFEDTLIGLQAAHAAGMDCYLFTGGQLAFKPFSNN
ncbi:carotenoid dehydrogenase [Pokkaliibacter plantistimulans]|uniref:Carotenoid dehydrogenase n=1 Tax=Proteobacteria bacterium 228 TaxID=2083153 RepID=A0A2S5KV51_9PROT|nr:beta-phosphoglucomutase family hydrolase [Pokkaliibacter plantistimulans]PPC78724.1 carotenoid dehydrogenase [Pokkaliibacter plantistimulans]